MEKRKLPVVAIDGPAGAGKSTVGRKLACQLGFRYIDTGAIYRALALTASDRGVEWSDEEGLAQLVIDLPIRFVWSGEENRILLADIDESVRIRSEAMSRGASVVSRWPKVRAGLLELQRSLGAQGGIVMDGRDIGTVIFPDAEVKVFLQADVTERARRRQLELAERGQQEPLERVEADIRQRDALDAGREVAPLKQAEDAILVDTTGLGVEGVVERLVQLVKSATSSLTV